MLLIWDLKRPERFYYLLHQAEPDARGSCSGAVVLLAFAAVDRRVVPRRTCSAPTDSSRRWPGSAIPAAVMTAGYTAFLFGQAEGRDLWQSPVLFWHLQAQALMAGAGALLVVAPFVDASESTVVALGSDLRGGDRGAPADARSSSSAASTPPATPRSRRTSSCAAATPGPSGSGRSCCRCVVLAGGLAVALGASAWLGVAVGLLVQVPLLAYESVFVKAAQDVPLS